MIDCDPHALAAAAKCFCFDKATAERVGIYILATWANGGVAPKLGLEFGEGESSTFVLGDPDAGIIFGEPE